MPICAIYGEVFPPFETGLFRISSQIVYFQRTAPGETSQTNKLGDLVQSGLRRGVFGVNAGAFATLILSPPATSKWTHKPPRVGSVVVSRNLAMVTTGVQIPADAFFQHIITSDFCIESCDYSPTIESSGSGGSATCEWIESVFAVSARTTDGSSQSASTAVCGTESR